jgi:hypothetical protein
MFAGKSPLNKTIELHIRVAHGVPKNKIMIVVPEVVVEGLSPKEAHSYASRSMKSCEEKAVRKLSE